jgi:LacI family transcriptional regulator
VTPAKHVRIAIIMPTEGEYGLRLTEGAIDHAARLPEVELVDIAYTYGDGAPLAGLPLDFDGAVVWLDRDDRWVEELLKAGVKVINTNGEWPEEIMPCVGFDGVMVRQQAMDHLLGLGRKQAAYVGWATAGSALNTKHLEAYLARCQSAGIAAASFEAGQLRGENLHITKVPAPVRSGLARFIAGLPKPAAVWCEDDMLARLVCDQAGREGIAVPAELAVLGVGDLREAQMGRPAISTIAQPGQLVGSAALAMVADLLHGRPLASRKVAISPPPVIVRQSTVSLSSPDAPLLLAREWILKHACEGITVNELMELVPMSQHTFSKRFANLFGRTPGEEIRRVRMEHAKSYLRQTTFSIERIARLCGYDRQTKFCNFFKREAGMSPSEYRLAKGSAD